MSVDQKNTPTHHMTAVRYSRSTGGFCLETAIVLCLVITLMLIGLWQFSKQTSSIFAKASEFQQGSNRQISTPSVEQPGNNASATRTAFIDGLEHRLSLPVILIMLAVVSTVQVYLIIRRLYRRLALSVQTEEIHADSLTTLPEALFEKRQLLLRQLAHLKQKNQMHNLRIENVMSTKLFLAQPSTSVAEISDMMHKNRIRHVLICDKHKNLVGMISDRDIGDRTGGTARQIMTRKMKTVTCDMEVIPAITTMMNCGISALPVLNHGNLIGILTTTDIVLILQCTILLGQREACTSKHELDEHTYRDLSMAACDSLDFTL